MQQPDKISIYQCAHNLLPLGANDQKRTTNQVIPGSNSEIYGWLQSGAA